MQQRITALLSISTVLSMLHVLKISKQLPKFPMFLWRSQHDWREMPLQRKRKAENLTGSGERTAATKYLLVQVVWITEIESGKCIADLKTSHLVTRAKTQTNFEVLGTHTTRGFKKINDGDFKRRVSIEEKAAQRGRTISHRKAGCMDDLCVFQDFNEICIIVCFNSRGS